MSLQPRQKWLAERQHGIGASEVAAILGLSPFASPMSVYAEKTGAQAPVSDDPALAWGLMMEPAIATAYKAQTGREVAFDPPFTIHRHHAGILTCTLDGRCSRRVAGGDWAMEWGPLEFKNVDSTKADEWAEMPPLYYQVQVQAQMAVMESSFGAVAACIGGRPPVCFDLERDDAFIETMLDAVSDFWQLVVNRTPPPPDPSEATKRALGRIYPRQTKGRRVRLPPEAEIWFRMREEGKEAQRIAQAKIDEAEAEIKAAMGEAEVGEIPGCGEITWKAQEQASYTVPAMVKRVLRVRGE